MSAPRVTLDRPWLTFDLGQDMRVLSWALNRPGFVTTDRILWREIRNADLPEGFDVYEWLEKELTARGDSTSVAFLTSRNITQFERCEAEAEGASAHVVATVGLSNAERVGVRQEALCLEYGTINVAVRLNTALSETGLIEALSVAVEARTAAVMEARLALPQGVATGTGTDCVAIAAPKGQTDYAGLHTDIGEVVGRAVYEAVHMGAMKWKEQQGGGRNA